MLILHIPGSFEPRHPHPSVSGTSCFAGEVYIKVD